MMILTGGSSRTMLFDMLLFEHLRELGRELARALRTAAQRPTISLVAVATLAIGIGASTATFSIADAVLMRPLPVHEQRNLSVLWGVDPAGGAGRVPVPYQPVEEVCLLSWPVQAAWR